MVSHERIDGEQFLRVGERLIPIGEVARVVVCPPSYRDGDFIASDVDLRERNMVLAAMKPRPAIRILLVDATVIWTEGDQSWWSEQLERKMIADEKSRPNPAAAE